MARRWRWAGHGNSLTLVAGTTQAVAAIPEAALEKGETITRIVGSVLWTLAAASTTTRRNAAGLILGPAQAAAASLPDPRVDFDAAQVSGRPYDLVLGRTYGGSSRSALLAWQTSKAACALPSPVTLSFIIAHTFILVNPNKSSYGVLRFLILGLISMRTGCGISGSLWALYRWQLTSRRRLMWWTLELCGRLGGMRPSSL